VGRLMLWAALPDRGAAAAVPALRSRVALRSERARRGPAPRGRRAPRALDRGAGGRCVRLRPQRLEPAASARPGVHAPRHPDRGGAPSSRRSGRAGALAASPRAEPAPAPPANPRFASSAPPHPTETSGGALAAGWPETSPPAHRSRKPRWTSASVRWC
jgi:hypothetical protein